MKPHYACVLNKDNQETFSGLFFNDLVVSNDSIARIIRISIFMNDEHIFNVDGDGLIVSTSQGSTAYSLSAGGPIIHPSVDALVLTPVCAHTLNSRPIVVPESSVIKTTIFEDSNNVVLTLDGQLAINLKKTDVVKTHNPKHPGFQIITNPKRTYLSNLRDKFIQGKRF
jgi:NAD+ kinase